MSVENPIINPLNTRKVCKVVHRDTCMTVGFTVNKEQGPLFYRTDMDDYQGNKPNLGWDKADPDKMRYKWRKNWQIIKPRTESLFNRGSLNIVNNELSAVIAEKHDREIAQEVELLTSSSPVAMLYRKRQGIRKIRNMEEAIEIAKRTSNFQLQNRAEDDIVEQAAMSSKRRILQVIKETGDIGIALNFLRALRYYGDNDIDCSPVTTIEYIIKELGNRIISEHDKEWVNMELERQAAKLEVCARKNRPIRDISRMLDNLERIRNRGLDSSENEKKIDTLINLHTRETKSISRKQAESLKEVVSLLSCINPLRRTEFITLLFKDQTSPEDFETLRQGLLKILSCEVCEEGTAFNSAKRDRLKVVLGLNKRWDRADKKQ